MPIGVYVRTKPVWNRGVYKNSYPSRSPEWRREYKQIKRRYVQKLKANPCMDCGGTFPACCMEFDHVRGTKIYIVSAMVGQSWSMQKLKEEIAKCDLVCANCHRIRHQRPGETNAIS